MNTAFWFLFTITCGIVVVKYLPKLIEWVLDRILGGSEDTE